MKTKKSLLQKHFLENRGLLQTLSIIFVFFFSWSLCAAQIIPGAGVNIHSNPQAPKPGDTVTITVESSSTNLNTASFSWYVDGALKKQGVGVTSYSIVAGGIGTVHVVEVSVQTKDIGSDTKKVLIAPATVDIVAQADTFIPPFYKGKVLAGPQGKVIFIATPVLITSSGKKLSSKDVIFSWKKDGEAFADKSGVGVNTFSADAPYISGQTETIEVQASAPDYGLTAKGQYVLNPKDSSIIFYENNPLLGVLFNRALSQNYALSNDEITLSAYPFSFDSNVLTDPDLSFVWAINGKTIDSTGTIKNTTTLRRPQGVSGSSLVSLSIASAKKVFETASQRLTITFNAPASSQPTF